MDLPRQIYGLAGHWFYMRNATEWVLTDGVGHFKDYNYLDLFVRLYKELGARAIRLGLDWHLFEPERGRYDFRLLDDCVSAFTQAGVEVIGLFYTIPDWATANGVGWGPMKTILETEAATFTNAVEVVVQHYPQVRRWEFWNEPMGDMAEASVFARWFRLFLQTVRQTGQPKHVAMGTKFSEATDHTLMFAREVNALVGEPYEAIVLHPYIQEATSPAINYRQIESVHREFPEKQIWLTEYGWRKDAPFSEDIQDRNLQEALPWIASQAYIKVACLHMLHDVPNQENFGLVNGHPISGMEPSVRYKAFWAFQELARAQDNDQARTDSYSSLDAIETSVRIIRSLLSLTPV